MNWGILKNRILHVLGGTVTRPVPINPETNIVQTQGNNYSTLPSASPGRNRVTGSGRVSSIDRPGDVVQNLAQMTRFNSGYIHIEKCLILTTHQVVFYVDCSI